MCVCLKRNIESNVVVTYTFERHKPLAFQVDQIKRIRISYTFIQSNKITCSNILTGYIPKLKFAKIIRLVTGQ